MKFSNDKQWNFRKQTTVLGTVFMHTHTTPSFKKHFSSEKSFMKLFVTYKSILKVHKIFNKENLDWDVELIKRQAFN